MSLIYWLELTAEDMPPSDDWLSGTEAAQLAAMRFPKRRMEWRLGRWTAKRAVTNWQRVSAPLNSIEIRAKLSGAPEVRIENRPAPVAISLSHRAGRALCAVAPAGVALGCDLEIIEPHSLAFVADYFTGEEQVLICRDRSRLATLFWSAKESALKALQVGLRADTRSVSVTLEGAALRVRHTSGRDFQGRWEQHDAFVRTLVWAT